MSVDSPQPGALPPDPKGEPGQPIAPPPPEAKAKPAAEAPAGKSGEDASAEKVPAPKAEAATAPAAPPKAETASVPATPPKPAPATYPRSAGVTLEAVPKASLRSFLGDAFGMLKGMGVTFGYLKNPKRVVTRQYPENRAVLKMTERFRAQVVMPHDADGEHTCTACTLCEKACPNGSINILTTKNLASKRVLGAFIYRLSTCTLCNLCIEACPYDAIRMGHGFEMAAYSRDPLELILNRKEGR